jgi:hypothetical protein
MSQPPVNGYGNNIDPTWRRLIWFTYSTVEWQTIISVGGTTHVLKKYNTGKNEVFAVLLAASIVVSVRNNLFNYLEFQNKYPVISLPAASIFSLY